MPNIPEYQMKTTDLTNRYTANTGPESAPLSAFDPFSERAGASVTEGLDAIANEQNRHETKEDMVWAQSQFMQQQVAWAQKIPKYTDPDQLNKDLTAQTQQIMNTAPTGRASDFFVAHMNALAPRLMRRTMLNNAKAQVGAVSANFVSSANSLATLATGEPLPDTSAQSPTDGSAAAQPDPVPRPMLSSSGLRQVYDQTNQIKASATGTVPSSLVAATDSSLKTQVSKGIITAASIEDGPGAIAAQLKDDPDKVIPSDSPLKTNGQLDGIINDLLLQHATNQGIAVINSKKALAKDIAATDQGNYPGDAAVLAHANMVGDVMGGKGGKKADEETANYLLSVKGSLDAFNFKTSIIGATPDQVEKQLSDFTDEHGDNPHALVMAQNNASKLLTTLAKSPADYPLASPTYRDTYNAAYSQLQHAPQDPAVISHFQNVTDGGITIQNKALGITDQSSQQDIDRATSQAGVIPEQTAKSIVNTIQSGTTQAAVQQLHNVQDWYGPRAGNAMRDLMRQGLDAKYLAVASLRNNPGMEATFVDALNLDSPLKGKESANSTLGLEDSTGATTSLGTAVKNAVADAFKPYSDATNWNNDGIRQTDSIQKSLESLTKSYMIKRGITDPTVAAPQAYKDLIGSQMDVGTVNNRNFMVTKQYVPDGNTQSVIDGANTMIGNIAKQSPYAPPVDVGFIFGKKEADVTQDDKDEFQQAMSKYGSWVNTSDGKSLRLVINAQQLQTNFPQMVNLRAGSGNDISSVLGKNGKPIEIPLQNFQRVQNLEQNGDPRARPFFMPRS